MIRINLLAVERERTKKKAVTFQAGQKLTVACTLILILAIVFVGWRYWTITRESAQLDADITAAQQETARLRTIIVQVQQFEQRRAQLQQRVLLIEQLRKGQTGPVHMLDQVSRALPQMLSSSTQTSSQPMKSSCRPDACVSRAPRRALPQADRRAGRSPQSA
jgi:type IV pilus assembly protein PilN